MRREAALALLIGIAACDHAGLVRAPLHVTSGKATLLDATRARFHVESPGMRAVASGHASRAAEVAFTYLGPTDQTAPLANGELRRQIGLKLRAQDTCNLVYVTWHIEPDSGVFVSVKSNPGAATHEACGAHGYIDLPRGRLPRPAPIQPGQEHVLRADLDDRALRVFADGALAWEGVLPAEAMTFDGPAGVRTDNAKFDLELRVAE